MTEVKRLREDDKANFYGHIVYWSLHACPPFTYADMNNKVKELGLSSSIMPKPMTAKKAWTRAVSRWNQGDGIPGVEMKPIKGENNMLVHGAVIARPDETSRTLNMEDATWVALNLDDEKFIAKDPDLDICKQFEELFVFFRDNLTNSELQVFLRKMVEQLSGFPIRPTGGIYFVPQSEVEVVDKCMELVNHLNPHAHVYALPMFVDEQTKGDLIEGYKEAAYKEIMSFQADLKKWLEAPGQKTNHGFKGKFSELQEMRAKALMYEGLLDGDLAEIRDTIHSLEKELKGVLQGKPAGDESEANQEPPSEGEKSEEIDPEQALKDLGI